MISYQLLKPALVTAINNFDLLLFINKQQSILGI